MSLIRPRAYSRDLATLVGVLPITKGGTGATSTQEAAENLEVNFSVANLAGLKALTSRPATVIVKTGQAAGIWEWEAGDSTTANDGTVVQCSSGAAGRYKRIIGSYIDARWFISDLANAGPGINAALAAAETTTGCVILPKGASEYIVDAPPVHPAAVAFIGLGYPIIKLKSNCSPLPSSMLTGTGTVDDRASNILLQGIIFDGNRENNINHGTPDVNGNQQQGWEGLPLAAVAYAYTDGVTVRDVQIKNMWAGGLWLVDCPDAKVDGCTAKFYRKAGFSIRRVVPPENPGAVLARLSGNYAEGGTIGFHGIFGVNTIIYDACQAENNKDENGYPAFAWDGTYPNVWPKGDGQTWKQYGQPGYVSPVNPGDGAGFEITGYHTAVGAARDRYLVLNTCTAKKNQIGFRFEQECNGIVGTGNIAAENVKHGLLIFSATDITWSGGQLVRNGEHGVSIEKASGQAVPSYINISGTQISRNGLFGIAMRRATNVQIASLPLFDNWTSATGVGGAIGLFRDGTDPCVGIDMDSLKVIQNGGYWLYYDHTDNSGRLVNSNFTGVPTAKMNNVNRTNTTIRGNQGIVTRNGGQSTVNMDSFVTINHGLDFTPNAQDISFFFVTDEPSADARLYLSATITSTQFSVLMKGGIATQPITWRIDD